MWINFTMWYILNNIFRKSYSNKTSKNIPKIPKPSRITLIPKSVFYRFSHRSTPCIGGSRGWGTVHVVAKNWPRKKCIKWCSTRQKQKTRKEKKRETIMLNINLIFIWLSVLFITWIIFTPAPPSLCHHLSSFWKASGPAATSI